MGLLEKSYLKLRMEPLALTNGIYCIPREQHRKPRLNREPWFETSKYYPSAVLEVNPPFFLCFHFL